MIDPAYLTDAAGEDMRAMIEGIRKCRVLAATKSLGGSSVKGSLGGSQGTKGGKGGEGGGQWCAEEILPGPLVQTDAELEAYVKASACHFLGSLGGTCRMGPDGDSLRVVDHRLRVVGVAGLRVVDASVMPTLTCGQINGPVTMIAERAAAMIIEDAARA